MKSTTRFYTLAFVIFLLMNVLFTVGRTRLEGWKFDQSVLLVGNIFLFSVTLLTFFLHKKAMEAPSTPAFLRWVYMAMFGKLMLCALAAMVYIFIAKQQVNKPSLFFCMFLYILYTFAEIRNLMKMYKERKNAG